MTQQTGSPNDSSPAGSATEASDGEEKNAPRSSVDVTALARRVIPLIASAFRLLTTIFAVILVVHVVLTVSGANPTNAVRQFFQGSADGLTLGLGDLFVSQGLNLQVILSYGIPAVVWLVIGFVLARVLRAITP